MELKIIYFVQGTTIDNEAGKCSGWKHIDKPFPNGESLKDVEKRVKEFIEFLKANYQGKKIGIVAHRAPQLALEVLTKNISWEEANKNDWRKTKSWKPGWEYIIK